MEALRIDSPVATRLCEALAVPTFSMVIEMNRSWVESSSHRGSLSLAQKVTTDRLVDKSDSFMLAMAV